MPYVITTCNIVGDHDDCIAHGEGTRREVATLEEACEAASDVIQRTIETHIESDGFGMSAEAQEPFFTAALNLPESGGIIGPLPDGTVIRVERLAA